MGASYCIPQDVRDYGVAVAQANDSVVSNLVEIASRVVDNYTGMSSVGFDGLFASTTTKTVVRHDVRTPLVPLFPPCPFSMFLASPAQPTLVITGGAAQELAYQAVAVNSNGDTIPSPAAYTLTGPTTLDGTHTVAVTCGAVTGATNYKWLRTVGGITQGLIGTTTAPTFTDTGVAAVSYAAAYINNPLLDSAQIRIDGRVISSSAVQTDDNYVGLRMYTAGFRDSDGFPRSQAALVMGSRGPRAPYGSKVEITGTWGYTSVPSPVKESTVLVAAYLVARQGQTPAPLETIGISVEGYSVRYGTDQRAVLSTTGVVDADRLLNRYRISNVQVG